MTSIIGYTRTFHPSCSIAPVQRHHSTKTDTPNFHRIFSRESTTPNGMIELIVDKNPPSSLSLESSKITINTAIPSKTQHTIPRYKNYNTYLSIGLSCKNEFDEFISSSFDNLQRLMNFISQMAYKKTLQFVNLIELLKQLQRYQHKYQFISCVDKQNQRVLIYFPNQLSNNTKDTNTWLQQVIGVDYSTNEDWHLFQQSIEDREEFDGKKYFQEINTFIDQVDALLESNGLFSHKKPSVL